MTDCKAPNCRNRARQSGLCARHLRNMREHGEFEPPPETLGKGGPLRKEKPPEPEKPKQTNGPVSGVIQRGSGGRFVKGNSFEFPKGVCARPGGFPTNTISVREVTILARERSVRCIEVLSEIMEDQAVTPMARVAAINSILDRGFGKPTIPLNVDGAAAVEYDESGNALNALLLSARLAESRRAKVIDAVAVDNAVDKAANYAKAIASALESGLPKEQVEKIIASALRQSAGEAAPPALTFDDSNLAPYPEPARAAEPAPEAAPPPEPAPLAGEATEADRSPPAPNTSPEPATPPPGPANFPGFAEFAAKREAERKRGNGTIKLV